MSPRHCFAAAVLTNDMHPRMEIGESVIYTTDRAAQPDDNVLVALRDGSYVIRELVEMDQHRLVVRTYSPDATREIAQARIARIFPIVGRCFCSLEELMAQQPGGHDD